MKPGRCRIRRAPLSDACTFYFVWLAPNNILNPMRPAGDSVAIYCQPRPRHEDRKAHKPDLPGSGRLEQAKVIAAASVDCVAPHKAPWFRCLPEAARTYVPPIAGNYQKTESYATGAVPSGQIPQDSCSVIRIGHPA